MTAKSEEPIARPKQGPAKPKSKLTMSGSKKGYVSVDAVRPGRPVSVHGHKKGIAHLKPGAFAFKVAGVRAGGRPAIINKVRHGLKYMAVNHLQKKLNLSDKEVSHYLSIPLSTLYRRKKDNRLQMDESDRIIRLARLTDQAMNLMDGDEDAMREWMLTPQEILGDESPLEHAITELGARDVEDLIGRLKHGVFS